MLKKIAIIVLIVAILYLMYTKQSNVENFSIPFTDIPGYDLTNQHLANEDLCLQACERDPKCLFYNYDTVNQTCWMKQGTPNSNFEVGLNGTRLLHGDNVDLNFNVLNTAPVNSSDECATLSSVKGHNVWKFDKTGKKCLSGKVGASRPNLTTGATSIQQTCPPPPVCPTCPPPTVCPTCETCKKCWLPAMF